VIIAYIDAYKDRFGIEPITPRADRARDTDRPQHLPRRDATPVSPRDLADAYLTNALVDVYKANRRVYGVRKLWHALRRAGHDIGRDQTARLMRTAGITGVLRGRHTTTTTTRDKHAARARMTRIGGSPNRHGSTTASTEPGCSRTSRGATASGGSFTTRGCRVSGCAGHSSRRRC
jgi:HTH-like domain